MAKYDVKAGRKKHKGAAGAAYAMQGLQYLHGLGAAKQQHDSAMAQNRFNDMLTNIEESQIEDDYSGRLQVMEQTISMQQGELNAALAAQGVDVGGGGTAAQLKGFAREQFNENLDSLKTQFVSQQLGIEVKRAQLGIDRAAAEDARQAAEDKAFFDLAAGAASMYFTGGLV